MGLRMNELHTPSTGSGPTNGVAKQDMSLHELMAEQDRVQRELSALSSVLDSHGVDMRTSLITPDGYPRDDLDIAQTRLVRSTRARVIHLQNDLRGLYDRIEVGLHEHHAAQRPVAVTAEGTGNAEGATNMLSTAASSSRTAPPFAWVDTVFGACNWTNHEKLKMLAETVARNVERPIAVRVMRGDGGGGVKRLVGLQLTPKHNWGGRGMLGCHLMPM